MADPLELTFGVELEFCVRFRTNDVGKESILTKTENGTENGKMMMVEMGMTGDKKFILLLIAQRMRRAGLEVNDVRLSGWEGYKDDYSKWTVDTDNTIWASHDPCKPRGKWKYVAVEVKSPVLKTVPASLQKVWEVVELIKANFAVFVNDTCGLHVHIGNENHGFPLTTLKNFAMLVAVFERQINCLHPQPRLNCVWAWSPSACIGLIDKSRLSMASEIASYTSLPRFISRMTAGSRFDAYNFENLTRQDRDVKTVEFRQHEGTMEAPRILAWIQFCAGLIKYSQSVSLSRITEICIGHANDPEFDIASFMELVGLQSVAPYYLDHLLSLPDMSEKPPKETPDADGWFNVSQDACPLSLLDRERLCRSPPFE
ncbi:MAG: hypothetical protein M1825_004195 [Sarcosagium campestre]|nr:MAG: hypothetical protein M1825_004195 [Sarcosagium campestre]